MDWAGELQKIHPIWILVLLQMAMLIILFLRSNAKELKDNTHAVIALQVEMRNAIEKLTAIPQLQKDMNGIGAAMREMKDRLKAATK